MRSDSWNLPKSQAATDFVFGMVCGMNISYLIARPPGSSGG